jgi:hypothetical protein
MNGKWPSATPSRAKTPETIKVKMCIFDHTSWSPRVPTIIKIGSGIAPSHMGKLSNGGIFSFLLFLGFTQSRRRRQAELSTPKYYTPIDMLWL